MIETSSTTRRGALVLTAGAWVFDETALPDDGRLLLITGCGVAHLPQSPHCSSLEQRTLGSIGVPPHRPNV